MSSRMNFEKDGSQVVGHESTNIDNLRLFLCGAHSVGKTTLAQEIVKETNIHLMTEVARKVIREMGMKREDFEPKSHPQKFLELQRRIIQAQAFEERMNDQQLWNNGLSYISDRGIDPVVYASLYLGKQAAYELLQLEETKEIIQRYKSSILFVIKPFPECISEDSVRLQPIMDEMVKFTSVMENLLETLSIPYILIDVLDLKQRVKIVLGEMNKQHSLND